MTKSSRFIAIQLYQMSFLAILVFQLLESLIELVRIGVCINLKNFLAYMAPKFPPDVIRF